MIIGDGWGEIMGVYDTRESVAALGSIKVQIVQKVWQGIIQ
jgi:hypothetical protein